MTDLFFIKCLFFVAGLPNGVVNKAPSVIGGSLMGGAVGSSSEYTWYLFYNSISLDQSQIENYDFI